MKSARYVAYTLDGDKVNAVNIKKRPRFYPDKTINRRTWIKAEKYERLVASKLGSVTVVNGVVYGKHPKRMRKSGIAYPVGYWKMLYNKDKNFERCFFYENKPIKTAKGDKLKHHLIDCKKLTRLR